jgi:hypothetical protein
MIPLTSIDTIARVNAPQNGNDVQRLIPQAANAAKDSPTKKGTGEKASFLNFICPIGHGASDNYSANHPSGYIPRLYANTQGSFHERLRQVFSIYIIFIYRIQKRTVFTLILDVL